VSRWPRWVAHTGLVDEKRIRACVSFHTIRSLLRHQKRRITPEAFLLVEWSLLRFLLT